MQTEAKKRIGFLTACVATVALVYLLANLILSGTVRLMARNGYSLEEAVSKAMLLKARHGVPSAVVVGSSRVQNHLDTALLGEMGIAIFNFGLPARGPSDYFYPVEQALEAGAREVIISLSSTGMQLLVKEPTDRLSANIIGYGKALDSEAGFRRRVEGIWSSLPLNRYPTLLKYFVEGRRSFLRRPQVPELCGNEITLERVAYLRGAEGHPVAVLKGGDSVVCFNLGQEVQHSTRKFLGIDPGKRAIVSALVDTIHAAGGVAYLLIQSAAPGKTVDVDLRRLRRATGADGIIDLGGMGARPEEWGDVRHLNVRGRRTFTLSFARQWNSLHRTRARG